MTETIKTDKRDFLKAAALVGAASGVLSASAGRPALAQMLETGVRDDSVLAKIRKEGVLRVGYAQTGPWFYKDAKTGELGGIYKDVVDQLCRELQIKAEYKEVTFANSTVGLRRGDYDLFGSSLTYTIQRALVVNYIGPLWSKGSHLLIHKDSADRFKTAADLNSEDVTFSVTAGASEEPRIPLLFPKAKLITTTGQVTLGAEPVRAKRAQVWMSGDSDVHPVRQAQQQLGRGGRSGEPDRPPAQHMGGALRRRRMEAVPRLLGRLPDRQRRGRKAVQASHGEARRGVTFERRPGACPAGTCGDLERASMIIDCHAHVFQNWKDACGHPSHRDPPQVPPEGGDPPGGAGLSRARRRRGQAAHAVPRR